MRKILIVDDENIERKGLRCLVETIGGEFEIREAKNGREALAEAKKMQPDIVLTDIKMPFMDGVELAEKISDIRPDTVTILVSGYSDFEYARRGLQCGVRDYILKPVDPEVFTEVFLKAVDEVEQKKETGMQMQKNHEFLEEYFLLQFLYKGAKEIQREAAGLLDVSWWEKVRRVVILETLDSFFDEYDEEFRAKLAEELKLPFFYLNIDINRSVLLFTDNVKVDYPVLGNHIHSFARQTFRQDVYVAISEQLESGMDMPEAYRRVEGLMENRFYRREEWVFTDEGSNDDFSEKFTKLFDAMEEDIRLRDIAHLWEHFHALTGSRQMGGLHSQIFTKFSGSKIVDLLYKDMRGSAEECNKIIEKIYISRVIQEIYDILENTLHLYEETVFNTGKSGRSDVETVKSYVYEHYAEPLSAEILSSAVYLSTGYMSYIFKKETGEGLNRFIKIYRLEKARELLETTNKKIVQICQETGFSNASYFCKSFREYYGMSPEKFRKGEDAE